MTPPIPLATLPPRIRESVEYFLAEDDRASRKTPNPLTVHDSATGQTYLVDTSKP